MNQVILWKLLLLAYFHMLLILFRHEKNKVFTLAYFNRCVCVNVLYVSVFIVFVQLFLFDISSILNVAVSVS